MELMATLPSLWDRENIRMMMECDEISSLRYNSGVDKLMSSKEVIDHLKALEEKYKKIYIYLKGR